METLYINNIPFEVQPLKYVDSLECLRECAFKIFAKGSLKSFLLKGNIVSLQMGNFRIEDMIMTDICQGTDSIIVTFKQLIRNDVVKIENKYIKNMLSLDETISYILANKKCWEFDSVRQNMEKFWYEVTFIMCNKGIKSKKVFVFMYHNLKEYVDSVISQYL